MTRRARIWPFVLVAAGLASGKVATQPQPDNLDPYRATYTLLEGNKRVGESVFTLSYDATSQRYVFESRSRFRGLLRLAAPRPVVDRSEFVVTSDSVRPITFSYEDGTRRGRRNLALRFDWSRGMMIVQHGDNLHEEAIGPATLDRSSVRVALMREVANGHRAGTHVLADPDVIRAYDYVVEATEELETTLGVVTAHRIRQQRDGSSRHTLTWLAPSMNFVMLRMEQHREDRDAVAFVIESIEWLEDGASSARD